MINFNKYEKNNKSAFSLADILIALAIATIFITSIIFIVVDTRTATTRFALKADRSVVVENIIEKIQLVKQNSWMDIFATVEAGTFHIETNSEGKFILVGGSESLDEYSYYFESFYVYRDGENNIVTEGGIQDPYTVKLSITIDWQGSFLDNNTETFDVYLNNWNTRVWGIETDEDFANGSWENIEIESSEGGSIVITKIFYPDWCNPTLFLTEHDIPGLANIRTVLAGSGYAYLGTAGGSTGDPFTKVSIDGFDPPVLTVEGTFSGHTVNDILVVGDYAFLATSTADKEVLILDISSVPFVEVGYYDAPGSARGKSIFVSNGVGYLGQGRYLRSFDLSSYTGSVHNW